MTAAPAGPSAVFIFAGAGLSRSAPTSLAMFDGLRDALLTGLGLQRYVPVWGMDMTKEQRRIKRDSARAVFRGTRGRRCRCTGLAREGS